MITRKKLAGLAMGTADLDRPICQHFGRRSKSLCMQSGHPSYDSPATKAKYYCYYHQDARGYCTLCGVYAQEEIILGRGTCPHCGVISERDFY